MSRHNEKLCSKSKINNTECVEEGLEVLKNIDYTVPKILNDEFQKKLEKKLYKTFDHYSTNFNQNFLEELKDSIKAERMLLKKNH